MQIDLNQLKLCKRCGQIKPAYEFNFPYQLGRGNICRACYIEYHHARTRRLREEREKKKAKKNNFDPYELIDNQTFESNLQRLLDWYYFIKAYNCRTKKKEPLIQKTERKMNVYIWKYKL